MLVLWRSVEENGNRALAQTALMAHAATAAAIVNTIAGKETPEFQRMIDSLMGSEQDEAPSTIEMPALDGFVAGPSGGGLTGFEEF